MNETRLKEIEQQIKELKEQLENVQGTVTTVYKRIVGYYRPTKNWNNGKHEEEKQRVEYKLGCEEK